MNRQGLRLVEFADRVIWGKTGSLNPPIANDCSLRALREHWTTVNQPQNPATNSALKRAAVAVIAREQRFLTILRSQTVRAPGKICFPGGGLESNETIEQALVREMQEELGIRVLPTGHVWQSLSNRGVELNWWRAEIVNGEVIKPNADEVETFQWMTVPEMLELPNLLDSNLEFFKAHQRGEFQI